MTGGFWRPDTPLVLASSSATRVALLAAAGIPVETERPDLDERALEARLRTEGAGTVAVAQALAHGKAASVSASRPGRFVLGADQTLECDGRALHKPADAEAAVAQILALAGRTHFLHSAAALLRDGEILAECVSTAALTMRPLSPAEAQSYVALAGPAATASVGGYQLEGLGIHLFAAIEGDHFTILGLPLLALFARLRDLRLLS